MGGGWQVQALEVRVDGQPDFTMPVPISDEAMSRIVSKRLLTVREANNSSQRYGVAYLRLALRRLEHLAAEGRLDEMSDAQREQFVATPEEDTLLARMIRDKTCEYQLADGRDLYCSAAALTDKTVVGMVGLRKVAPTNRATCNRCALPDTDMVCSHLHHPRVVGAQLDQGELDRSLGGARCDLGNPEIGEPARCKPGGNHCWERVVETRSNGATAATTPLMLHEAFDFLDVVWQVAFGRPLLDLKATAGPGRLASSPTTREEVMSAASDLSDIFARFDVPDSVLNDAGKKIPKGQTLDRLEAALLWHPELDNNRVTDAIRVLQAANQSRNGMQHTAAAARGLAALARLGVETPVTDWKSAWSLIRSAVVKALTDLREETRKVQRSTAKR